MSICVEGIRALAAASFEKHRLNSRSKLALQLAPIEKPMDIGPIGIENSQ